MCIRDRLKRGNQHFGALNLVGAPDPVMNWGRPENSGFRSIWNTGIELNDKLELYTFGNYSATYGNYGMFYRVPNLRGVLTPIPNDPNDPSKGNFNWGDAYPLGFTPRLESFQKDFSSVTGIKGELESGLKYDISTSFGYNRINYLVDNTLNPSWGPLSKKRFKPGDLQQYERNFNVDLSKKVGKKINVAVGVQNRNESYTMYAGDEQSYIAGPWANVGQLINPETGKNYDAPVPASVSFAGLSKDNAGKFKGKNWGAYADVEVDVSRAFLVQLAYRFEHYKVFGSTNNIKIAGRYTFSDWLTLRGGFSTGFRTPTPGQANVVAIITSFDGVSGQQVQEGTVSPLHPLAQELGGKKLSPETSKNISLGAAARLTSNLSLTLDYYSIDIDDRIIKSKSLPTDSPLFSELAFYTNSLKTATNGVDVKLLWRKAQTNVSLTYNYNQLKVLSQKEVGGQTPVSDATIFNLENNLPKNRVNLTIFHDFGKLSGMLRANYYSRTIDERSAREELSGETLLDVELTYPISNRLKFVLGANNILNNYPDMITARLSQGMPFPRRSPIGYHGGMVYFKAICKL